MIYSVCISPVTVPVSWYHAFRSDTQASARIPRSRFPVRSPVSGALSDGTKHGERMCCYGMHGLFSFVPGEQRAADTQVISRILFLAHPWQPRGNVSAACAAAPASERGSVSDDKATKEVGSSLGSESGLSKVIPVLRRTGTEGWKPARSFTQFRRRR